MQPNLKGEGILLSGQCCKREKSFPVWRKPGVPCFIYREPADFIMA